MKRQWIVEGLVGILLLIGMATAQGAEYCVNSAGALNTALTAAGTNGQDDTIRVVQGTYTGLFYYSSSESRDVTVLGGYTSGCASRTLDPANTTLQGGGSNTVLVLVTTGNGDFTLEGVTVTGGNRSGNGGGLYTTTEGDVTLAKNRFDGNTASGEGGGAYIDSGRDVALPENRFSANGASGSAAWISAGRNTTLIDSAFDANLGHGVRLSAATGAATLTGNSFTDNSRGGLSGLSGIFRGIIFL